MEEEQLEQLPNCPHCDAEPYDHENEERNVVKNGKNYQGGESQRYLCKVCGKTFTEETAERKEEEQEESEEEQVGAVTH